MRTISRGSVHVDQCDNCQGVFLDGGELEQIIAAERAHYAQPHRPEAVQPADGAPPPYQPPPGTQVPPVHGTQPGGAPPPYQPPPGTAPAPPAVYPAGYHDPYYPRRRRSFLEELLD